MHPPDLLSVEKALHYLSESDFHFTEIIAQLQRYARQKVAAAARIPKTGTHDPNNEIIQSFIALCKEEETYLKNLRRTIEYLIGGIKGDNEGVAGVYRNKRRARDYYDRIHDELKAIDALLEKGLRHDIRIERAFCQKLSGKLGWNLKRTVNAEGVGAFIEVLKEKIRAEVSDVTKARARIRNLQAFVVEEGNALIAEELHRTDLPPDFKQRVTTLTTTLIKRVEDRIGVPELAFNLAIGHGKLGWNPHP